MARRMDGAPVLRKNTGEPPTTPSDPAQAEPGIRGSGSYSSFPRPRPAHDCETPNIDGIEYPGPENASTARTGPTLRRVPGVNAGSVETGHGRLAVHGRPRTRMT